MPNQNLMQAVKDYVADIRAKSVAQHQIKQLQAQVLKIDTDIKTRLALVMSLATPTVQYIDVDKNEVVVVSTTIFEICPLTKGL